MQVLRIRLLKDLTSHRILLIVAPSHKMTTKNMLRHRRALLHLRKHMELKSKSSIMLHPNQELRSNMMLLLFQVLLLLPPTTIWITKVKTNSPVEHSKNHCKKAKVSKIQMMFDTRLKCRKSIKWITEGIKMSMLQEVCPIV